MNSGRRRQMHRAQTLVPRGLQPNGLPQLDRLTMVWRKYHNSSPSQVNNSETIGKQCSVSCGEGVQVRMAECRDAADQPSTMCSVHTRPSASKPCSTGIPCPRHEDISSSSEELLPGLYHTQPLLHPYPPPPAHAERLVGEPPQHTVPESESM